ncbi:MAG: NAD(P)H-dependent oxidoreductase, partial [Microbacterium sp.]|uniref:NAD(P)H-dependent oxidoreductase n=1 Tax=Microbacterium sp. TaxID=51671 RepID=UPI003F9C388D
DRLAFVFPVYWWSMPALMKGWIERVFTAGWAYQYGTGIKDRGKAALHGLLPSIPTVLVGIGGSKERTYEKYGYDEAMRTQLDVGVFAYSGINDVESHLIYNVEGDHNAPVREAGLDQAREIGRSFAALDRTVRQAKEDHLKRQAWRMPAE